MRSIILAALFIANFPSAMAGGVSGGGGNLRPKNPVSAEQVASEIQNARKYVLAYFNELEFRRRDESETDQKLFFGAETIMERVGVIPITVSAGACLDPAGNEMDGSAIASAPQSICLSLSRLTEKLGADNLRTQVVALAVHEYSHLLGTTEEEADALQARAISDLASADYAGLDQAVRAALLTLKNSEGLFRYLSSPEMNRHLWDHEWASFSEGQQRFSREVSGVVVGPSFRMLSEAMRKGNLQAGIRFELIELGLCVLAKNTGARHCKSELDALFRGAREISLQDYWRRKGNDPRHIEEMPEVSFIRLTDARTASAEYSRMAGELRHLISTIQKMQNDSR